MNFDELLKRRTVRRFLQKEIPVEKIKKILDAARCASCARNAQRLRYIAAVSTQKVEEIFPHTAYAGSVSPRRNPVPGVSAPKAFIAVYGTEEPDNMLYADAGAAIQSMEFAAWEEGIGSCWIGSFSKEKVAAILGVEKNRLLFLVALGWKGEDPVMEDIPSGGSPKYFLDEKDVLHIPKYTVDALTKWV